MTSEVPFKIAVSDEKIKLLKQKLALATFPDELDDAGRDYGVPLVDIRRLVARWSDGYDWRKHETNLNAELPQFTKDIDIDGHGTLNVHYVHKKSEAADAIPLLFVHGWPGSFLEVRKILPLLTKASSEHVSFHVVAFSLPGYGFSEAPRKPGFEITQFAELGHKLMLALGYDEYGNNTRWGLGHLITYKIAIKYGGKHNKAWHTNFPLGGPPQLLSQPLNYLWHLVTPYTPAEKAGLARAQWFRSHGQGYYAEQSTQPQTLGYGLTDSPVGLLAWIYEKLVNWTDAYPWDDDEVLTWISIYWFSRAGPTASLRIYYEATKASGGSAFSRKDPVPVPMGFSYFPQELARVPRIWLRAPNLVFEAEHESGGHFAAHEKPEELVGDLRKMFGNGGPVAFKGKL